MAVKTINVDKEVHKEIERLRKENKRSYSAQVSFMLQEKINQDKKNNNNIKKTTTKKVISSNERR